MRSELRPGDRVFAPDRFSDWMLFKIPELRGRVGYDVRFELYDRAFFDRLQDYNFEDGPNWKSFADGYRIVIVDETRESHTADFLKEPGARVVYRDDEITIVARAKADQPRAGRRTTPSSAKTFRPGRIPLESRCEAGADRPDDARRERAARRRAASGSCEVEHDPLGIADVTGPCRGTAARRDARPTRFEALTGRPLGPIATARSSAAMCALRQRLPGTREAPSPASRGQRAERRPT